MSNVLSVEKLLETYRVRRADVAGLDRLTPDGASAKPLSKASQQAERVGKVRARAGNRASRAARLSRQGHFGEVVKAQWKGKQVVVKISRTKALDERRIREARADLENECRLLGCACASRAAAVGSLCVGQSASQPASQRAVRRRASHATPRRARTSADQRRATADVRRR